MPAADELMALMKKMRSAGPIMRPSKATLRFLPALVLVLLAAPSRAHGVGSLWTGEAKLALASDAPAAKPDGTTAGARRPWPERVRRDHGLRRSAAQTRRPPQLATRHRPPRPRRLGQATPADGAAANTEGAGGERGRRIHRSPIR